MRTTGIMYVMIIVLMIVSASMICYTVRPSAKNIKWSRLIAATVLYLIAYGYGKYLAEIEE